LDVKSKYRHWTEEDLDCAEGTDCLGRIRVACFGRVEAFTLDDQTESA
jgi:hypothetical protein